MFTLGKRFVIEAGGGFYSGSVAGWKIREDSGVVLLVHSTDIQHLGDGKSAVLHMENSGILYDVNATVHGLSMGRDNMYALYWKKGDDTLMKSLRGLKRYQCSIPVSILCPDRVMERHVIIDVSEGGVAIVAKEPHKIPMDRMITIYFNAGGMGMIEEQTVYVVSCRSSNGVTRFSCKFAGMGDKGAEMMAKYCQLCEEWAQDVGL